MKFLITLCNLYLAYADKIIVIDQVDKGTWIIKSGEFIPDSEKWLHQADTIGKLDKSIE